MVVYSLNLHAVPADIRAGQCTTCSVNSIRTNTWQLLELLTGFALSAAGSLSSRWAVVLCLGLKSTIRCTASGKGCADLSDLAEIYKLHLFVADLKGKDQNCLPSSIRKAVIERMIRILVSSETNVIVV